jgi:hypothetical protein
MHGEAGRPKPRVPLEVPDHPLDRSNPGMRIVVKKNDVLAPRRGQGMSFSAAPSIAIKGDQVRREFQDGLTRAVVGVVVYDKDLEFTLIQPASGHIRERIGHHRAAVVGSHHEAHDWKVFAAHHHSSRPAAIIG